MNNILEDISILKNGEKLPSADKYISLIYPKVSPLDYFKDSNIFIVDPSDVNESLTASYKATGEELKELTLSKVIIGKFTDIYLSPTDFYSKISKGKRKNKKCGRICFSRIL